MTIKEFNEALKNKKVSARGAVSFYLDKIKEKNGELNAYLEVFEKDAMADAKEIDERIAAGETPGELWGVPLAIKDNILIRGRVASAASKILRNYVASYDAFVIEKLKKSGAIFLGRTNMDEFAMGASTENSAYGPTKNPRDVSRVPGGSSGGSAAAVAGDLAMAALGSDTGGSIRQPAAFCGVVGLKPTYGAVSRSGLIAMASSLDQIGPITQTVEDTEMLFNVIRGRDELDSTSWTSDVQVDVRRPLVKKIGIPKEYFSARGGSAFGGGDGLDPQIKSELEETIKKLSSTYEIREISLPHTKYALSCYYIIVPAEVSSNMARYDGIRYGVRLGRPTSDRTSDVPLIETYKKSRGEGLGTEVRRRILLGTYVLSAGYYDAYYSKAQKARSLIKQDFENAFNEVDIILGPTTPTPPFKFGEKSNPLSMYLSDIFTINANLAGVPAIAVPPGVQLIAPHFMENRLFEVGKFIEKNG